MMNALEYLKKQELYWINIWDVEWRRIHMMSEVAPMFYYNRRVPAITADKISGFETQRFVDDWRAYWDEHKDELHYVNQPPGVQFREATQRANIAIRKSHMRALSFGCSHTPGGGRFLVAEDDIYPRSTLLAGEVPGPPESADVAIWSGGLPMAGVSHDDHIFLKGEQHFWMKVADSYKHNCLGAGLYEIKNSDVAEHIISGVRRTPMSYDHAWGVPFRDLEVWRLVPSAFAQAGPSIRNTKVREPVLDRGVST